MDESIREFPAPARRKRRGAKLLLCLVTIACMLSLSEFLLRRAGVKPIYVQPEQLIFWTHDSELGWAHRPGQEGPFETEHFKSTIRINSKGLRDTETEYEKPQGRKRIVVLGDSFVWGFGVEAEQRLTERLAAMLDDTDVINAGVSGYSTDQEVLWLEREGLKYQPDLIVLTLSGNDLPHNLESVAYRVYRKPRFQLLESGELVCTNLPLPPPGTMALFERWMSRRLSLYRAGSTLVRRLLAEPAEPNEKDYAALGQQGKEAVDLTEALLQRVRNAAARSGAKHLIVTNNTWWAAYCGPYDKFVKRLRLDGFNVLMQEECPGWSPETMVIEGDLHWNPAGHECIALGIQQAIETHGLLEAVPQFSPMDER